MKQYSIERKIIGSSLLGISIVFIVAITLVDILIVDWVRSEHDHNLLSKARVLITLTKEHEQEVELDFADEIMPEFERKIEPEYFQIWWKNGETFEKSHSLGEKSLNLGSSQELGETFSDTILLDGRSGRVVSIVFYPQIEDKSLRTEARYAQQKKMTISVAKEIENLNNIIAMVHSLLLAGTAVSIFMLFVVVRMSVRSGMQPLYSVSRQLQNFDARELDQRLLLDNAPRELSSVVDQFNDLMKRLESGFRREKQFSSDVAHELKTPIAELRSMAEIARKWPDDIELAKAMPADVLNASVQMQTIVEKLLALARCENGNIQVKTRELNLVESVESAWLRYESAAEAKNICFTRQFPGSANIYSSSTELDLILNNIFSNAIDYSPEGTVVTAVISEVGHRNVPSASGQPAKHSRVQRQSRTNLSQNTITSNSSASNAISSNAISSKTSMTLKISNTAEYLAVEDLESLFDRLWRKDQSRTSERHSGLGLALVEAYVNLLGIELNVSLGADSLFTISISGIPRSP